MKKTIFALLLVVALVVVLAIPAAAAEAQPGEYCVCGVETCDKTTAGHGTKVEWEEWDKVDSLPTSGYYYLKENVALSATCVPDGTLAINLNGKTISIKDNAPIRLFKVGNENSRLIIADSAGTGKLDYTSTGGGENYGYAIQMTAKNATVDLYGGTISGNRFAGTGGAAVILGSSTNSTSVFNMYGGTITGGVSYKGGNVFMHHGVFNMYGGEVSEGKARTSKNTIDAGNCLGGNFYLQNDAKLNVYGGEIKNGSAGQGGGVCLWNQAGLKMFDGSITGNSATYRGTAVQIYGSSIKVELSGGEITGNAACAGTGAVNLGAGNLILSGTAKIYGNKGANLYYQNSATAGTRNVAIGSEGMSADAKVGITMDSPATFISSNATSANGFFPDSVDYTISLDGSALSLKAVNAFKVGEKETTWSEAKTASEVQLLADLAVAITVDHDMTLDLAGHTLDEVNIAEGVTLKVYDSATAEYKADDIGVIKAVNGEGKLATDFVNGDNQRYLTIHEEGVGYSFHRFYLAVTHSVLKTGSKDMHYEVRLKTNPALAAKIDEIGIDLTLDGASADGVRYDAYNQEDDVSLVVETTGFDSADSKLAYLEGAQSVNAYIKIGEQKITSGVKTTSVKKMVQNVVAEQWETLDAAQKAILVDLYKAVDISGWDKIEELKKYATEQ